VPLPGVGAYRPLVPLRKSVSWTALGNVVFGLGNAGLLMVIARLGSLEMVGQFALGLAVTAPVVDFSRLGLRRMQSTDARGDYRFRDYLSLRVVTSALAVAAVAAVTMVAGYRDLTASVIIAMSLTKAFDSLSDIVYGLFQFHERMELVARSMILRAVSSVLALGAAVYLTGSILDGVLAMGASWAAVFFMHDYPAGRRMAARYDRLPSSAEAERAYSVSGEDRRWRVSRPTMRKLARLALISSPLGFAMLLGSLNVNIPRYFIEWHFDERALGLFAASAYLVQAGGLVFNAIGQAAAPRLSRYYEDSLVESYEGLLRRLMRLTMLLGCLFLASSFALGGRALSLLYGPEYAESADVLTWLIAAGVVQYMTMILGHALAAARVFNLQPVVLSFCSVATVGACYLLVPRFGLKGAAWAMGLVLALNLAGYYWAVVQAMKVRRSANPRPIADAV
jgi:O-antigen/teichoic acid export membrane protein